MEKFDYLTKKRNKALGLFGKVLAKLDSIHKQMIEEVNQSNTLIKEEEERIKEAQVAIDEEKAAIAFLEDEKVKLLDTRSKINTFLG